MRYRYSCPACETVSRPYALRGMADAHADDHRHRHHDGDHPWGEDIVTEPGAAWWDIPRGQAIASVIVLVVLIAAALTR
ncbi:hypothetical protein [Streptomyces sp. KAU_LT]|uniref:hypothetical protein n=1 Tax=Streptomyces sp. KAU_LT TaxID=3046669 RepID=UPI0024B80B73|nr:hypothetical protein [Streptomyces sp. KAU_LT]MDI9836253.1 hypothetical protein [Streptomyces sp. KAU_LT]